MGRRENGKGSVRKRTRGERIYWEGRYTNEEGKQKSICRESESECRQALRKVIAEAELKKEMRENDLAYNPDMTLDEWTEICFSVFFTKQKPQTIEVYKTLYRNYWQQPMGQKRLTEIGRADVQTVLSQMSEKEYSCSRIKSAVRILNKICSFAVREHLIEKSPAENVGSKLGKPKKENIALSDEQIQQFLVEAYKGKSACYALAALIALNTGLRAGEILAITWSDFTNDFRFVHIDKTVTNEKVLSTPKNEFSRRMVPIRSELREEILKYRNKLIEQGEYFVNTPIICNCSSKSSIKNPFSNVSAFDSWIRGVIKKIQKQYPDFPGITSHCFRHTFVSRAIKYGMPLIYLQRIGGWSSMDMITKVYSHIDFEQIYEAMNQTHERINNLMSVRGK